MCLPELDGVIQTRMFIMFTQDDVLEIDCCDSVQCHWGESAAEACRAYYKYLTWCHLTEESQRLLLACRKKSWCELGPSGRLSGQPVSIMSSLHCKQVSSFQCAENCSSFRAGDSPCFKTQESMRRTHVTGWRLFDASLLGSIFIP